jgi:hypothetical protein
MNCDSRIPCSDPIDPMGGSTIPSGVSADVSFVDGMPFWSTIPPIPPEFLPTIIVNQNDGGILIDEGIYLSI